MLTLQYKHPMISEITTFHFNRNERAIKRKTKPKKKLVESKKFISEIYTNLFLIEAFASKSNTFKRVINISTFRW